MVPRKSLQSRCINGIEILGPDIFANDQDGKALSPIAVVFPKLSFLVTGRGIHAELVELAGEFMRAKLLRNERRDLTLEEEHDIYENAVPLLVRDSTVLIRSYPDDMERAFVADEILQKILAKECIQFTGVHVAKVREQLRRRGQSWRISPPPRSAEEICHYIRASRVHVNTGTVYYQNAQSGERFLTYEEFLRIRSLMRKAPREALCRLEEINHLSRLVNDQGVPELSFFLPAEVVLTTKLLQELILILQDPILGHDLHRAEDLFDRFALSLAEAAGDELSVDGEKHTTWRTTMFCRLCDLKEEILEEWMLGLSAEFHMNIRWLPGVHAKGNDLVFEINVEPRVRNLVDYFLQACPGVLSINIGRVESPQTERDQTGQERQVYLVVLGLPHGREEIHLLRMVKWDVVHRIKQGFPLSQAIRDTVSYRDYIADRLKAATALGIPILSYTAIGFNEEFQGIGEAPVFFFDRRYVTGMVTDKIPLAYYARKRFVIRLAGLLGIAAAASMVVGRASYSTGELFFDDGDEVIQLNGEKLPERLIISETTGSFTDSTTPIVELLPQCLKHLAAHLEKAHGREIAQTDLAAAVDAFTEALIAEIERMQSLLHDGSAVLHSLFESRTAEPGSIRARWENVMHRLATTDVTELRHAALASPYLADFVNP